MLWYISVMKLYSRTSIIRISRLSGLFLRPQFGQEYLVVTIKIRSHILFKTTALKGHVLKLKRFVLSIKDKSSNLEVRTSIIRTSIIRISRLSGLFLRSQFGQDYLLVTIKILSHILFKTTALKGAVKCEGFCSQRAKAALALVVSNEEHSNEFWLDQSCVVARWNFRLYGMKDKEASVTNVYSRLSCLEAQAIRSFHKK